MWVDGGDDGSQQAMANLEANDDEGEDGVDELL